MGVKKSKPKTNTRPRCVEQIQECPAYPICQDKKVSCEVCLELDVPAWAEHVKKVCVAGC